MSSVRSAESVRTSLARPFSVIETGVMRPLTKVDRSVQIAPQLVSNRMAESFNASPVRRRWSERRHHAHRAAPRAYRNGCLRRAAWGR